MMEDFARQPIEQFLNQLADRTPSPGGGSAAALAGAIAAAQARMVAAYSATPKTEPDVGAEVDLVAAKLRRIDELLRAAITGDARAYTAMTNAAKAAKADPGKRPAHQQGVLAAVAVPMETAALASEALAILDGFKETASRYLLSDLGVTAVLADAVARAARYSVRVNLGDLDDAAARDRIGREIDTIVRHCDEHRITIEAYVSIHLPG